MYYLKWTEKEIDDLGIFALYVEVDKDGRVLREIGMDPDGRVTHKCPSDKFKYGTYGLFDNQPIETLNRQSDLTKAEFESMWEKTR